MTDWIAPAVGAAVLALLTIDVFGTAFHAVGRGGPINRRQNRALWRIVRWTATRGGRVRPGTLSLAGPLMAVTTIAVWATLLLVGFALVYLPVILDFHYSPGQAGSATLEAFYYSGIISATVGQGDVVAPGGWLRALTIVQGLAGFASVTVAVTYVLAVYREITRAQALASSIDAHLAGLDEAVAAGAGGPPREGWERSIALELSRVLEAHYNYPILHYFRPGEDQRGLPYQVARLFGHVRSTDRDDADPVTGSVSRRALIAMIHRYATEVHDLFVQGQVESDDEEGGADGRADAERLERIAGMMGYPSRTSEEETRLRGGASPGEAGARPPRP